MSVHDISQKPVILGKICGGQSSKYGRDALLFQKCWPGGSGLGSKGTGLQQEAHSF